MQIRNLEQLQEKMKAEQLLFSLIDQCNADNIKILLKDVELKPNVNAQNSALLQKHYVLLI